MRVADRTGSGRQALPGLELGVVSGCPLPSVAVAPHGVWRKTDLHMCPIRQGRTAPNRSEQSEQSERKPESQAGRGFRRVLVVPTLCSLSRNSRNISMLQAPGLRSLAANPHPPAFLDRASVCTIKPACPARPSGCPKSPRCVRLLPLFQGRIDAALPPGATGPEGLHHAPRETYGDALLGDYRRTPGLTAAHSASVMGWASGSAWSAAVAVASSSGVGMRVPGLSFGMALAPLCCRPCAG